MTLNEAGPYLISLGASAIQQNLPKHAEACAVAMDAIATMQCLCEDKEFRAVFQRESLVVDALNTIQRSAKQKREAKKSECTCLQHPSFGVQIDSQCPLHGRQYISKATY